jgi:DNA-binding CsgD family transcriptional regulator
MAVVSRVVSRVAGARDVSFWIAVREEVCRQYGIASLNPLVPSPPPEPPVLTRRQVDVLQLVADGASGPQAAEALCLAPNTIKTHLARIYKVMGATGQAHAVAMALRAGLIE